MRGRVLCQGGIEAWGLFGGGFCGDLGSLAEVLGSVDELLGVNGLTRFQSERPVTVVVEFERQKDLADEIDSEPLIYGSGDALGSVKSFVLRVLQKDAIFAIPGEGKSDGGSALLDFVDCDQSSGGIAANGDGPLDTADQSNER